MTPAEVGLERLQAASGASVGEVLDLLLRLQGLGTFGERCGRPRTPAEIATSPWWLCLALDAVWASREAP